MTRGEVDASASGLSIHGDSYTVHHVLVQMSITRSEMKQSDPKRMWSLASSNRGWILRMDNFTAKFAKEKSFQLHVLEKVL
jgi:hypothetical protein